MLRVSFQGFMKAIYFPLGESCAPEISGLPKSNSRSMMGGRLLAGGAGMVSVSHVNGFPRSESALHPIPQAPRGLPGLTARLIRGGGFPLGEYWKLAVQRCKSLGGT